MLLYLALTVSFVTLSSQQPHIPENTYETCSTRLDRGDACCSSPNNTIRFFFDPELEQCFTYLYEGCGGGRNTFYTEEDCRSICIPADKFTCGGNRKPTGSCQVQDMTCPPGSSCVLGGLGVGLCCDNVNEKQWEREARKPFCPVGQPLKRNVFYGQEIWIGKSCAHRFCPYGYECVQGNRVAHCCGPIRNFRERQYLDDNTINGDEYRRPKDIHRRSRIGPPAVQSNGYLQQYNRNE